MSDAVMWSQVAGFLSATFVLPIIQQPKWTDQMRSLVTFLYSIAIGAGTAWFTGAFDQGAENATKSLTTAVLFVFISAIATYKGFAKPLGIAPAIEIATSSAAESAQREAHADHQVDPGALFRRR